jgi:CubicO group peptidase (beta-lactamase class C family)
MYWTCSNRSWPQDPQYSAQLAAFRNGTQVVGLAGGPDMDADTITGAYSCSKGVAAMVIALLVQDGLLDLDAPVAKYWPEFAVHGKDRLLVREALSHQAGLMGVEGGFALEEFTTADAAARLAAAQPSWQPGRQFGYHALTIGIIMEELCRRTAGESLQSIYDRRIRTALDIDFFLGLPAELEPRYRDVLYTDDPEGPWVDPLSLEGMNSNAPRQHRHGAAQYPQRPACRDVGGRRGGVRGGTGPALCRRHYGDRQYGGLPQSPDAGSYFPGTGVGPGPFIRAGQRLRSGVYETASFPEFRQPPCLRP